MNQLTTFRWSFEQDVLAYAEAGYTAIGVWRRKLYDYGVEKGIELLEEHQLTVSNLLWAGGFTGSCGRSWPQCLDDACEAIQLAAMLNAPVLVVYTGGRNCHTERHARRLVDHALERLIPVAEDFGITLALEATHPACATEWSFQSRPEELLELTEKHRSPHLGIVLDTYHQGFDTDLLERLPELTPHVAVVHLGDGRWQPADEQDRCPLGEGMVPVELIVERMIELGYRGHFDVELLGAEIELLDYRELLAASKLAFESSLLRGLPSQA